MKLEDTDYNIRQWGGQQDMMTSKQEDDEGDKGQQGGKQNERTGKITATTLWRDAQEDYEYRTVGGNNTRQEKQHKRHDGKHITYVNIKSFHLVLHFISSC